MQAILREFSKNSYNFQSLPSTLLEKCWHLHHISLRNAIFKKNIFHLLTGHRLLHAKSCLIRQHPIHLLAIFTCLSHHVLSCLLRISPHCEQFPMPIAMNHPINSLGNVLVSHQSSDTVQILSQLLTNLLSLYFLY